MTMVQPTPEGNSGAAPQITAGCEGGSTAIFPGAPKLATQEPSDPPSAMAGPRSRRRRFVLIGLAFIVALGAVGYWGVGKLLAPKLPDLPDIDVSKADSEIAEKVTEAREAVLNNPRSAEAWMKLALTLHANEYYDQADICFEGAEALDPQNQLLPYIHGVLVSGGMFVDKPQKAKAVPLLRKAAKMQVDNSLPRLKLAEVLMERNLLDEAAAELEIFRAVEPDEPRALYILGELEFHRKDYLSALAHLRSVTDNPSVRKRATSLRAMCFTRLNDRIAAKKESDKLEGIPDDMPWPDPAMEQVDNYRYGLRNRISLSKAMIKLKLFRDARELLEKACKRYPKSEEPWEALANVYATADDFPNAEKAMQEAIKRAPNSRNLYFRLGFNRQFFGQYKLAAEALRKSIELSPNPDSDSYFKLGECLKETGDYAGAEAAFLLALRHRGDQMPEARAALEELKKLRKQK